MSRSGGNSEARPPVFKSPNKLGTHLSTHCSWNERETHKDSVGMSLHIQEANMDDITQTKTHTERAAASYITTEKMIEEREVSRDTSAFIPDVEDCVTFL
ncbi:hypothetical protein TNCV_3888661 [Trichonephila clavipes]|nr:hypothetical protein TNCV_3888661 [Trichonephila clavipes]